MTLNCMFVLSTKASKNCSLLVSLETKCYDAFNYGRQEEALRLLKKVKNPHVVKSSNNFTILHCAAYHGWLDVVQQLINEHQFDPDCMDDDGNTPLSKAKSNGKQRVVDYLETTIGTSVVIIYILCLVVVQSNLICRDILGYFSKCKRFANFMNLSIFLLCKGVTD